MITVPAAVHAGLPLAARRNSVFEYIGKNVGIRRAAGEFILATNPDTVFSAALVENLKQRSLREDTFYRVDRADVASPVPAYVPAAEIENYCRRNVLRIHGRWFAPGLKNRSVPHWLAHGPEIVKRTCSAAIQLPHLGAAAFRRAGRFHPDAPPARWEEMRGLP